MQITSVAWLAVMAEQMMIGAELAGCIMEVPEAVMGLTVTAAGTSLPNLFASLIGAAACVLSCMFLFANFSLTAYQLPSKASATCLYPTRLAQTLLTFS